MYQLWFSYWFKLYDIFATYVGDMSDGDRYREIERDRVWLHEEKVGVGFICKYCRETKSEGGGTRLKEHLAHRGKNVKKCPSVPPDIKDLWYPIGKWAHHEAMIQ
jgi:hypothetical protein